MSKNKSLYLMRLAAHLLLAEWRAQLGARWVGVVGVLTLVAHGLLTAALAIGTRPRAASLILEELFYVGFGLSLVLSVILSMRTFAEPMASGTWSVLAMSPLPGWLIVCVRWFATLTTSALLTACTSPIMILVATRGELGAGHVIAGCVGLVLVQSASLAIGVLASTLTTRQLIAAATSATILSMLTSTWLLAAIAPAPLDALLLQMSLFDGNFKGFMAGRITLSEVTYYLGITGVALLCATRSIGARRHV